MGAAQVFRPEYPASSFLELMQDAEGFCEFLIGCRHTVAIGYLQALIAARIQAYHAVDYKQIMMHKDKLNWEFDYILFDPFSRLHRR